MLDLIASVALRTSIHAETLNRLHYLCLITFFLTYY
jgi:hypothetical protein